jgi:RNA polymerase sigma-70 factor (ECF subfamily)
VSAQSQPDGLDDVALGPDLSRQASAMASFALAAPYGDDPAWHNCGDGVLAAAVVGRHGDAYAEICRRHGASVTAAVQMMLGVGSLCDDVVEDVFVEFWISPTSFDPNRGSLLGFLRLKARGRSIDLLRSEAARRRREIEDVYVTSAAAQGADAALLATEAAATVRRAVALLPAREREVVYLAFFEGLTYRAVALRLDLAEGTVKSRIRSGLRRLASVGAALEGEPAPPRPAVVPRGPSADAKSEPT